MVFPWAPHRVHGLYVEHTVSISPGYGEGKTTGWRHTAEDTTCSYEQLSLNARSQQLAFPAKPFPSTRKYQEVSDQSEPDESCTLQWAKHFRLTPQIQPRNRCENCWSQWQDRHEVSKPWTKPETEQEINTVPTEISPDLRKIHYFHYCNCSTVLFWPNSLTSEEALQCLFCNTTTPLVRHIHSYSVLPGTASSLW